MNARSEAEQLAGFLPGVLLEARRLAAYSPGVHGRRRAGIGESFWQFRDHRPEDGVRLVDWRRSARGERLYVREREREAAQTALFWLDPDPGFDWASQTKWPSKKRRALVMCLALASLLARAGERVGALGANQTRNGPRAMERLAIDLMSPQASTPPAPQGRPIVVLASDFYAPAHDWGARLKTCAQSGVAGAILMIADPAEEDFPYRGRTQFEEPGGARRKVLFGRAESAQDEYRLRLSAHRAAMRQAAQGLGFLPILHRTDHSAAPALTLLIAAVEARR
jgi:uncharacterized protein (DUF58 family)